MNTYLGKLTCICSLMLATVGGWGNNAWAQASPSKGEKQAEIWFKMLDSNRDDHLSWDEVKHISPLAKDFKAADTDQNGLVSREEIRVLSHKRVAERRARKAAAQQAKASASAAAAPHSAEPASDATASLHAE